MTSADLQAVRTEVGQLSFSCQGQVGTVRKRNDNVGRIFRRGLYRSARSEAGNVPKRCSHGLMSVETGGIVFTPEVAFKEGESDWDEIVKLSQKDTLVTIWRERPLALRCGFVVV